MHTTTALKTLRLSEGASRSDILSAFARLARRYPMQQFPEHHAALLEAKTSLLNPENFVRELLSADNLDVRWLNRHTKSSRQGTEGGAQSEADCLHAMLRQHFQEGELLLPGHSRSLNIEGMMERMDRKSLQKLLEEFEF